MPGNPLPTIEIDASRWPYDENGPVNGKFGEVEVTAAPKAVFDASNGNELTGVVGFTRWNTSQGEYLNEEIPSLPGERGIRVSYGPQTPFQNANGRELNYALEIHQKHVYEYLKIAQPVDYYMPREMEFSVTDFSDVASWEQGDLIESQTIGSGVTAKLVGVKEDGNPDQVVTTDFIGHPELAWRDGYTVHNITKGQSATISGGGSFSANNAKFMCLWVSDDPTLKNRGYENGNFSLGVDQPLDTDNPDFSGDGISKIDGSLADAGLPTENHAGGIKNNELDGMPRRPVVFDVDDNGYAIELVVERKRATGEGANDGVFALWKRVSRAGSEFSEWTELFRNESINLYSSYHDNHWTHGYLFGNKNGGYRVQTDFYLMGYQLWLEKPTFLIEAGV